MELLAEILIWLLIAVILIGIVLIISSSRFRIKSKKILPPSITIFGATHEFQTLEKREAIEHINRRA